MSQLQNLQLNGNSISGTLPPEWMVMSHLQVFELADNYISGTLPVNWGQLGAFSALSVLRLDSNQLNGEHGPGVLHQAGLPNMLKAEGSEPFKCM